MPDPQQGNTQTTALAADRHSFYDHDQNTHQEKVAISEAAVIIHLVKKHWGIDLIHSRLGNANSSVNIGIDDGAVETIIQDYFNHSGLDAAAQQAVRAKLNRREEWDVVQLLPPESQEDPISLFIPLTQVTALVYLTLKEKDGWPENSTFEQRVALLNTRLIENPDCNTGLRHEIISCLAGYRNFKIVTVFRDFLIACINDFFCKSTGLFPDFSQSTFNNTVLPWIVTGQVPAPLQSNIDDEFIDGLKEHILNECDAAMVPRHAGDIATINEYCDKDLLITWQCPVLHPLISRLKAWYERYSQPANHAYFAPITTTLLAWLENHFTIDNENDCQKCHLVMDLCGTLHQLHTHELLIKMSSFPSQLINTLFSFCDPQTLSALLVSDETTSLAQPIHRFEEEYRMLLQSTFAPQINDFFALKAQNEDPVHQRRLLDWLTLPEVKPAIQLTTNEISGLLIDMQRQISQRVEDKVDLDLYWVNRWLLHALIIPVDKWTPLFTQTLTTVLDFIKNNFNAPASNQLIQNLIDTSYPRTLLAQMEYLLACRGVGSLPTQENVGSLLLQAVKNGYTGVVNAILDRNPPELVLNARDNTGQTALMIAAENGHIDIITAILEKNGSEALINATDDEDQSALRSAAEKGHTDVVTAILEKNSSLAVINATDEEGWTALMFAAWKGNTDVVTAIFKKNSSMAVINAGDDEGKTALRIAAWSGHTHVVIAILDRNASIEVLNARDSSDQTALICAAAKNDHTDIVIAILGRNASIEVLNAKDIHGQTALMIAVTKGHTNTIKALLEKNVSKAVLEATNNQGLTALMLAALDGQTEIVNLLIGKGASFNEPLQGVKEQNLTPLYAAAMHGHAEVVKLLIDKGATFNEPMRMGAIHSTPFQAAVEAGHVGVIEVLIAAGSEITTHSDHLPMRRLLRQAIELKQLATSILNRYYQRYPALIQLQLTLPGQGEAASLKLFQLLFKRRKRLPHPLPLDLREHLIGNSSDLDLSPDNMAMAVNTLFDRVTQQSTATYFQLVAGTGRRLGGPIGDKFELEDPPLSRKRKAIENDDIETTENHPPRRARIS